jgi:hypothetical protein
MHQVRGPFPPEFRSAAGAALLVICALSALPAMAQQSIFKWVDDRGVVNYGNAEVPKNSAVSLVDTSPQAASHPAVKIESRARPARLSDADVLREQLARSQEEIARLRQASAANAATAPAASTAARRAENYAAWRAQCESEHRADCDEETFAAEKKPAAKPVANRAKPSAASLQYAATPKPAAKTAGGTDTSMQ